jgi:hypothetical protein
MHFETTLIRDILLFESGLELGLNQGLDQENTGNCHYSVFLFHKTRYAR